MFINKLNKRPVGNYTIEEEKIITGGAYIGKLNHDNVIHGSIIIYTEPNFSGNKVESYTISTPSEKPWETEIRVYSSTDKVYITYSTPGDQVDADDINKLQDRLNDHGLTIEEINGRLVIVESELTKKANKIYVDQQLNLKADKETTYTKEEVNQRIAEIVGNAPENLDTLEKLANALDNDESFASTITVELSNKVDKVTGKGLSTNDLTDLLKEKLLGIEEGAQVNAPIIDNLTSTSKTSTLSANQGKVLKGLTEANKVYVDQQLNLKANKETTYTKEEVNQRITDIVGNAPEALDTLKKLADALNNDPDFAATMTKELATKVDKVEGKTLTSNDYTNAEKLKLSKIEDEANKTTKTSQLTNDSNYVDKAYVDGELGKVQTDLSKYMLSEDFVTKVGDTTKLKDSTGAQADVVESILSNKSATDNKVDKVSGKVLSTNDYSTSEKSEVATIKNKADKSYTDTELSKKVDKVTGKQLSTNDYTTAEKTKLAGISAGANKVTKVSELANDTGFITGESPIITKIEEDITGIKQSKSDLTYVESEVARLQEAIDAIDVPEGVDLTPLKKDITELKRDKLDKAEFETKLNQAIMDLLGNAPEALNTLGKLAEALGNDPNFSTTIVTLIGDKADKVNGKQLSTNDYTTTEKNKLAGIEAGAQKNIMTSADKVKLDKFTEVDNKPYYNGEEIGGVVPNLTLNELTLGGRFKISYNDIEDSLDIEVI